MPPRRYHSLPRETWARIHHILIHVWDPLGVQDLPEADDEYDDYIGEIYGLLIDKASTADVIQNYLFRIAVDLMGLPGDSGLIKRCAQTATLLIELRPK